MDKRRDQRDNEFAPPSFYYNQSNQRKPSTNQPRTSQNQSNSKFAPPISYFDQDEENVTKIKKPKRDPMAMLEELSKRTSVENSMKIPESDNQSKAELNVMAGLQQIRTEMEMKQNHKSGAAVHSSVDSKPAKTEYEHYSEGSLPRMTADSQSQGYINLNIPSNIPLLPPPPHRCSNFHHSHPFFHSLLSLPHTH